MGPGQVWQSRERRRHDGYQRPVASSQPDGGALACGGERRRAVALDHAHRHADHTRHNQAGRWKPPPPRRFDASHLDPSGEVGDGGGSMATSGQSPATSQMAARSCVEANDAVQWHSTTPITTPITPGTTRLAAGRWPLEAPTATTLQRVSPRPIWRSRERRRHDGYQQPVASRQPDGGALVCGVERRRAVALDHAYRHADHTRHYQAGRWPLAAGSPHRHDASTRLTSTHLAKSGTAAARWLPAAGSTASEETPLAGALRWRGDAPGGSPTPAGPSGAGGARRMS